MPEWVQAACADYTRRLRGSWKLELLQLTPARRQGSAGDAARADEGQRLLATLTQRDFVVALDEHGTEQTSLQCARWLEQRRASGQDLACLIGGADGFDATVLARAQYRWSLSRLTLPHALARVVLLEQIYRAMSIIDGHPYHRE